MTTPASLMKSESSKIYLSIKKIVFIKDIDKRKEKWN
jgi:hypothetical protein